MEWEHDLSCSTFKINLHLFITLFVDILVSHFVTLSCTHLKLCSFWYISNYAYIIVWLHYDYLYMKYLCDHPNPNRNNPNHNIKSSCIKIEGKILGLVPKHWAQLGGGAKDRCVHRLSSQYYILSLALKCLSWHSHYTRYVVFYFCHPLL